MLVANAMVDLCLRTNPVSVDAQQMKTLMDKVYYGK